MFAESFEPRTENPRVENSANRSVNMHSEGFDLIDAFFMNGGFSSKRGTPVFFDFILPAMAGKVC